MNRINRINYFIRKHREACENWEHGEFTGTKERNGITIVYYEDGTYFHYKIENDQVVWW